MFQLAVNLVKLTSYHPLTITLQEKKETKTNGAPNSVTSINLWLGYVTTKKFIQIKMVKQKFTLCAMKIDSMVW